MYKVVLTTIIGFVFSCSSVRAQQKTEFLLVGVAHEIPDSLSCNWKPAYDKLVKFKPDQIAVEFIHPKDSASLVHHLGNDFRRKWDSIINAWVGKPINPKDSVDVYFKRARKSNSTNDRALLWRYNYLNTDVANQEYQQWLIRQLLKEGATYPDTSSRVGRLFWIYHNRTVARRSNSEYFNLVYPLAKLYKIPYLYPTDFRETFLLQSNAYEKFSTELDSTEHVKKYMDFWKEFNVNYNRERAACNIFNFTNTREWLKMSDYGQANFLTYTGNAAYKEYTRVWYLRNEMIAKNVIAAAKQSKAKRMVVVYGEMHIAPLKKYLEEQGYKVKLLEDL